MILGRATAIMVELTGTRKDATVRSASAPRARPFEKTGVDSSKGDLGTLPLKQSHLAFVAVYNDSVPVFEYPRGIARPHNCGDAVFSGDHGAMAKHPS
jgi:hypothetical protein